MSIVNYALKEISCKVVYYGPGLGGKTTNLQVIFKSLPEVNRGELVSLATQQDRTLFFDFLPMDLGAIKGFDTKFHLYTVPGQVYYNATRKLVLRGVDGIVFVADSQKDRVEENRKSIENLRENLQEYGYDLNSIPWVIQYNKRDLDNIMSIDELEQELNPNKVPYFEGVAITGLGVKETLKKISSLVLDRLKTVSDSSRKKKSSLADLVARTEDEPDLEYTRPLSSTDLFDKRSSVSSRNNVRRLVSRASVALEYKDPLESLLPLSQKSTLVWKGVNVGSAFLTLKYLPGGKKRKKYLLSSSLKFLAFINRLWDVNLIFRGKRSKVVNNNIFSLILLTDTPESRPPLADPFNVWIKDIDTSPEFYLTIDTKLGKVRICPYGKKSLDLEG
jgi:mutual gliding-motility protein MglA